MRGSRKQAGNMLTVVSLTTGMTVAVTVAGLTFNSFLFQCGRVQSKADAIALQLAGKINAGDRVGQINELEQCSRELVYISRQELKRCEHDDFSFLTPVCQQLMYEAEAGHRLVESERKNQIQRIEMDLRQAADKYNTASSGCMGLNLPWLQTCEPEIVRIDVGYIDNVESNVKSLDAIKELAEIDRQRGYVDRTTRLYKANIDAGLPEETDSFKISGLPAYVEKTCAPARNTNPDVFVSTGTVFPTKMSGNGKIEQIPNAIQIVLDMNARFGLNDMHQAEVGLVSTAATNGAIAGSD